MFNNYIKSIIGGRGYQPMFDAHDDGGGSGSDDGGSDDGQDDGQGGTDDGGSDDGSDDKSKKVEFDEAQQTHIQNLINKTIKEERTRAEKERQKELDRQKMDDKQKAEADLEEANNKIKAYNDRVLGYEIKDVAREAGVPAKKLERFMKVIDREGLMDDDGEINSSKVKESVEAVLGDMPEFKASDNKKGPGDYSGGGGGQVKYSMAQVEAMTPKEIADNYDEVMKSIQFHQK